MYWRTDISTWLADGAYGHRARRVVTSAGYVDLTTGKRYWYVTNRQGSTMAVVDEMGAVVQRNGYYPSGTPYVLPSETGAPSLTEATDRLHIGNRWLLHSGLNWYDNTARMHDQLLMRFGAPDPLYADFPDISPWSHCAGNSLNLVDENGCFFTEEEATAYVQENFPGASVQQDNKSQHWFVCLNEFKTGAYTTGGTLTREFGPYNPYLVEGSNIIESITSSLDIANSTKLEIIQSVVEESTATGSMAKYLTGSKYLGKALGFASAFSTLCKGYTYYSHGGDDPKVYCKYVLDIVMSIVTSAGPEGIIAGAIYFGIDIATDGWGLDYSVPEPIVKNTKQITDKK